MTASLAGYSQSWQSLFKRDFTFRLFQKTNHAHSSTSRKDMQIMATVKERSMERITVTVGQGYASIIAREALSEFADYGCSVLYQEHSDHRDDTTEIYADYITAKDEDWLSCYYREHVTESTRIKESKR